MHDQNLDIVNKTTSEYTTPSFTALFTYSLAIVGVPCIGRVRSLVPVSIDTGTRLVHNHSSDNTRLSLEGFLISHVVREHFPILCTNGFYELIIIIIFKNMVDGIRQY